MLGITLVHGLLFVFSLTFVGFLPMFYNLILTSWCYSCYLTLREREIIVYFLMIVVFFTLQLVTFFAGPAEGSLQSLAGVSLAGIYIVTGWVVAHHYYNFRVSGGLHGF